MTAVILAGVLGARISEDPYLSSKPMVKIVGQPTILEVANLVSVRLKDFSKEVQVITNSNGIIQNSKYQFSSKIIEFENALAQKVLFQEVIHHLIKLQLSET